LENSQSNDFSFQPVDNADIDGIGSTVKANSRLMIIILMRQVQEREHLTKVLSTKLSIEDYDSIKKIARELFEKRIIKAPTTSELITASLVFVLNQHTNTDNMEVILGE
jgi:DNA-directed RNA polymerase alpha subunit